jgi:phage tail-like protein
MVAELHNRRVVRVPEVIGLPFKKARIIVEDAGLTLEAVLYRESYEERDTVLDQRPARGQMIYEGSRVTLWVARRGYMEQLPAIYRRSDAVGRNVVRDICFLFEHMFGSIEEVLEEGHRFYDPHECPPEFLDWLASWTAMVMDMDWPETKKRAILKRGVDLYRIRGTKRGLVLFLKLFTGHEPLIEENEWPFKGFRVGGDARVGLDSVVLPPVERAHCFIVTMPVKFTDVSPEMVIRIHRIIQMEKPAHTQHYLRFASDVGDVELRDFFAIGLRSGIGIGAEIVKPLEGAEAAAAVAEFEAAAAGRGGGSVSALPGLMPRSSASDLAAAAASSPGPDRPAEARLDPPPTAPSTAMASAAASAAPPSAAPLPAETRAEVAPEASLEAAPKAPTDTSGTATPGTATPGTAAPGAGTAPDTGPAPAARRARKQPTKEFKAPAEPAAEPTGQTDRASGAEPTSARDSATESPEGSEAQSRDPKGRDPEDAT